MRARRSEPGPLGAGSAGTRRATADAASSTEPDARERERAEREQLIVTAVRELAENEGWNAVTTRRPAAEIEYSRPVLLRDGDNRRLSLLIGHFTPAR